MVDFRLIRKRGETLEIPLKDGLIINKENEDGAWLIEIFIHEREADVFRNCGRDEYFPVQVIITKPDNDPAYFSVRILSLKFIRPYASVLMEGALSRPHSEYAEQLLESLIEKGLAGQELLKKFREKMRGKKGENRVD